MEARQLIQAQELSGLLDSEDIRIIDCRFELGDPSAGHREYSAGHIPGAVYLDLNQDLASEPGKTTGRHPLPDARKMEMLVRRLGINNSTSLVVYDGGNGAMAARAWWTFRWMGHDSIRLLDGGLSAWNALQLPLSLISGDFIPGGFVANVRNELVVTSDEIMSKLDSIESLNLIDARDESRFRGQHEPIDNVAGHIPGASNLPFVESLNADGTWKENEQLRELWYKHLGDDRAAEWVAMCGSGVTACHLALSAVEAGYSEPRLYVGSWSEWISDSTRPIG